MLSTTNSLALSLIREAAVSTPCAEKECAIVKALCDSSLLEARELLRMYMEKVKTSQFYLQTLEYLLDHNPTLFTYALDLSRGGWHRRYKDRKYLVRGSLENVKTLQKHLLDEKVRFPEIPGRMKLLDQSHTPLTEFNYHSLFYL